VQIAALRQSLDQYALHQPGGRQLLASRSAFDRLLHLLGYAQGNRLGLLHHGIIRLDDRLNNTFEHGKFRDAMENFSAKFRGSAGRRKQGNSLNGLERMPLRQEAASLCLTKQ
jgi:hypothetical protein